MTKYDERFKLEVVRRYLCGTEGYRALAKEFGVGSGSSVRHDAQSASSARIQFATAVESNCAIAPAAPPRLPGTAGCVGRVRTGFRVGT